MYDGRMSAAGTRVTDRNGGVIAGVKGIFRPCCRFGPGGACVLPGRAPGKRLSARLSGLVRGWPSGMDEQVQPQVYCLLPLPLLLWFGPHGQPLVGLCAVGVQKVAPFCVFGYANNRVSGYSCIGFPVAGGRQVSVCRKFIGSGSARRLFGSVFRSGRSSGRRCRNTGAVSERSVHFVRGRRYAVHVRGGRCMRSRKRASASGKCSYPVWRHLVAVGLCRGAEGEAGVVKQ